MPCPAKLSPRGAPALTCTESAPEGCVTDTARRPGYPRGITLMWRGVNVDRGRATCRPPPGLPLVDRQRGRFEQVADLRLDGLQVGVIPLADEGHRHAGLAGAGGAPDAVD